MDIELIHPGPVGGVALVSMQEAETMVCKRAAVFGGSPHVQLRGTTGLVAAGRPLRQILGEFAVMTAERAAAKLYLAPTTPGGLAVVNLPKSAELFESGGVIVLASALIALSFGLQFLPAKFPRRQLGQLGQLGRRLFLLPGGVGSTRGKKWLALKGSGYLLLHGFGGIDCLELLAGSAASASSEIRQVVAEHIVAFDDTLSFSTPEKPAAWQRRGFSGGVLVVSGSGRLWHRSQVPRRFGKQLTPVLRARGLPGWRFGHSF